LHFLQSQSRAFAVLQDVSYCDVYLHFCIMNHPPKISGMDAIYPRYLAQRKPSPGPLEQYDPALVIGLLFSGSPTNVTRLVMPIVMDAIKRGIRRCWANVVEESLKIVEPFFGHANATSAIVRILLVCGRIASTLRMLPRAIFARASRTGMPMNSAPQRNQPAFETPAALAIAAQQIPFLVRGFVSALTAAIVVIIVSPLTRVTKHCKETEGLSRLQIGALFLHTGSMA